MRLQHFMPFFLLLLLGRTSAQGQQAGVFKGIVMDSVENIPLEGCTVSIVLKEGTKGKAVTSANGGFSLSLPGDSAVVLFRHVGYAEKKLAVLVSKQKGGTDTVRLAPAEKKMEEVVVKAKVPPVVIRGDTTEYNIDSSMFEPFDAVQDLVRRLPGLAIDAAGKMTFHGKPITRILVDGEDLFGGDPGYSLQKIPAGMVAKIQVMDTKTLEQIFNRLPVDGDDKTLNIKLKAGNKTFGSAAAAAGTKNNLEADGNLSRFNEGKRINLTGGYNSSNKTGLFKTAGGPTSSAVSTGIDYGDKLGPVRVNGSYTYNRNTGSNETYRERTQLLTTDTSFLTKAATRFNNAYAGHRVSLSTNWWTDSSGILDAALVFGATESKSEEGSSSLSSENGALRNESLNRTAANGAGQNVSATATWRKWLNRKGRSLFVTASANKAVQRSDLFSQSTNTYFANGRPVSGDTLDRQTKTVNTTRAYSVSFTYSEPLSKKLYVNVNGNFNWNRSNSDRAIYNLDSLTHKATFDSSYSAAVFSAEQTQNVSTALSYRYQKWNASAGLSTVWQQTLRTLQKQSLRQNLLRYSPTLNASYSLSREASLRAAFSAATIQPTIEQLQPVPDNSNPLYIRLGNPRLRTAFAQSYTLNYNYAKNSTLLNANAGYSPVSNQIVNAVTYDAYRRVTSQAINVSGVYTARAGLGFARFYRKGKTATDWNASSGLTLGQQVYFQANNRYRSRNYAFNAKLSVSRRGQAVRSPAFTLSFSPTLSRNWTPETETVLNTTRLGLAPEAEGGCSLFGFIYLTASYRLGYNRLNYHSASRRNDEYNLHQVAGNLQFGVRKKWTVQTAFSYQYNTQAPDGVNKAQFNSNLSVNGQLARGRGRISLTASDLFATKAALQRIVGSNYIEDVQVANLRNYLTLRLQWGFSKLERKEKAVTSNTK